MNIKNNTVLITGGGSGIVLETAKLVSKNGNKVIIVGRDEQKLREAAEKMQNLIPIRCDITNAEDVVTLVDTIRILHNDLNIVMNNAGKAYTYNPVSYTHLRAHETGRNLVCRLLLEKKKK